MLCDRCGHAEGYHHWTGSHYTECKFSEACWCKQFVPDQPYKPLIPGSYQKGRPSPDDTFYSIPWKDISLPEKPDAVNPSHYDGDACMRAIEQATKYDSGAIAFLRGQIIKYSWRLGRKDNPEIEAGKLKWYLDRLVSLFKDEADAHRKSISESHLKTNNNQSSV